MLLKVALWGLLAAQSVFADAADEGGGDNDWDFPGSNKVVHLDDDGFDTMVSETERVLVMFYAPWCGHCKSMKPDFAAAAKVVAHKATLAAVDCTKNSDTCSRFEVNSYPTLKYFNKGEQEEFDGDRSSGAFINFVDKKIPDDEFLKTAELAKLPTKVLKKFLKQRGEACKGCTERQDYIKLLEKVRHLPKKEKPKPKGSSLVNGMTFAQERRHKEAVAVAEEGFGEDNGEVVHVVDFYWDKFRAENPKTLVMFYAPWCGHCKSMKPEIGKASTSIFEKGFDVTLAAMDCTTNPETCQKFSVSSYPTLKYFGSVDAKGSAVSARTADEFVEFVEKAIKKESKDPLAPFENENPWDVDSGKVLHLTDDYFAEHREKGAMLAFFYAPWCGHCKAAKPNLIEASSMVGEKVMVAAIDCDGDGSDSCAANAVQGFPTIKFFKNAASKGKVYEGDRSASDLVEFVNKQLEDKTKTPARRIVDDDELDEHEEL